MAITTNNAYLSNYVRGILDSWLDSSTVMSWPSSPSQWWYGLLSNNSAETEVSYSGYSRVESTSVSISRPSGTHAVLTFDPASGPFAPFAGSVNVTGVGIWSAQTGGNLLAYVTFGNTYSDGDELDLSSGGVVLRFSSSTAGADKKANPIGLPIYATCAWISNETTVATDTSGILISELISVDKTLRSAKIVDTISSTGSTWDYPVGGEATYGNGVNDHAVAVNSGSGIVARSIASLYPSASPELCLTTSIDASSTGWVNPNYGITVSGRITSIEYGMFVQSNPGAPPPDYVEGEADPADPVNIWVKLAKWNLTGSNGSFTAPSSKMAFTLGMSTRGVSYQPNPTYGGSLTGITFVNPSQTTTESGYAYEHEMAAGFDSTVSYTLSSIYSDSEFQHHESSPDEVTFDVPPADSAIEIVEMSRFTADVRSGDSNLAFSVKLRTQDNDIPNISGKDLRVRYSVNGGAAHDVWASFPSDYYDNGRVIFALPASAFENPGQVRVELALVGVGGSVMTLPYDDTIFIGVMDSL